MLSESTAGSQPAPSTPAFVDLHAAYRGRVAGFFFRRGVRPQDIEDLVQSTFAEAWRSWPTFVWTADQRACQRQFTAWLFTIALHQLWNARRHADRHAVAVPLDEVAKQLPDAGAGVGFDQALDRALLAPGLALLSPAERQLLADAYTHDQDDRGLGHRLRLRPDTAKARRQRAVRHWPWPWRRASRHGGIGAGAVDRPAYPSASVSARLPPRRRPNLAALA